jgi:putative transcriptional regulator
MTVYATKAFSRFTGKADLEDGDLLAAAEAVMAGRFDADLGGGVYKRRVARKGGGSWPLRFWDCRPRKSRPPYRQASYGNWWATMATKTSKKTETGILASVHETATGLHRAGVIDKATMREFDALCLTPVEPLSPDQIRAIREREQVSQPVFAHYLNVRKDAVSKWERGEKRPNGPSLKLLNLVKAKGLRAIA